VEFLARIKFPSNQPSGLTGWEKSPERAFLIFIHPWSFLMNPLETYLRELYDIRSTGAAAPETSYSPFFPFGRMSGC
jgi:hypothetical protein